MLRSAILLAIMVGLARIIFHSLHDVAPPNPNKNETIYKVPLEIGVRLMCVFIFSSQTSRKHQENVFHIDLPCLMYSFRK